MSTLFYETFDALQRSRVVSMRLFSVLSIALCSLLTGCSHTVISGGGGDEAWSPVDGRYKVSIAAHGAAGRAYTELTDKRVELSITTVDRRNNVRTLYRRNIRLRAADLSWRIRWKGSRLVSVTFSDKRPGEEVERVVDTYSFAYDADTHTFREAHINPSSPRFGRR